MPLIWFKMHDGQINMLISLMIKHVMLREDLQDTPIKCLDHCDSNFILIVIAPLTVFFHQSVTKTRGNISCGLGALLVEDETNQPIRNTL